MRSEHLGSFAHELHMDARQVDGLRFIDFVSYVLWIERYNAECERIRKEQEDAAK